MSVSANELVHIWNHCHACEARPIVGPRFECQTCPSGPDNDLCETCYRLFEQGKVEHPKRETRGASLKISRHTFHVFEGAQRSQYLPWLAVPQPRVPAPRVPDHFVVRPEFCSGKDSFFGGYAFVVSSESNGPPLVLTALHVMDELMKSKGVDCSAKNPNYTGQELPRLVTGVNLYDVFAKIWALAELGSADSMLALSDARTGDEEPHSQRDIAAFRASQSADLFPVKLAETPPNPGEPIWLVANRGPGIKERTIEAVVVELSERTLVFRYSTSKPLPQYTSGAPLINREGNVVGINVGGGFFEGQYLGHGNHVTSIRRHLNMATAADAGGKF